MKNLLIIFFLLFQSQDDVIQKIETAMKAGSSKGLLTYCNSTIEIKMGGKSANYSKSQSEALLKDFFSRNQPTSFSYIHQGASPDGLKYTIGKLNHTNGSHRVVMFIKKIDNDYLIDTINFSKE